MNKPWKAASAIIAAAAIATMGLSGCSAPAGEADGKTLKVWWWENDDSALSTGWNRAIELFEEKHPDVKVEFELKTYEQMQQSGQLLLDSNDAPDVLEYLKGNATAGVVSQAGLPSRMWRRNATGTWTVLPKTSDSTKTA